MQINLPDDVVNNAIRLAEAGAGKDSADVFRKAIALMDSERQAIQEGIHAWQAGDVQDWNEFIADFRTENEITPEA